MKITLCGSSRFRTTFEEWNHALTMDGHIVYTMSIFGRLSSDIGKASEAVLISEDTKQILDLVYLAKIEESDAIVVLNVDGYIGFSTKREIQWAKIRRKVIYALHPNDLHTQNEFSARSATDLLKYYNL